MLNIIDMTRFPINVVQDHEYCIPASVETMLNYNNMAIGQINVDSFITGQINRKKNLLNVRLNQWILMRLFMRMNNGIPVSFGSVQQILPQTMKNITVNHITPPKFKDWMDEIKTEIDDNYPIAISTKLKTGDAHIRVAIGYNDQDEYIRLYNAGLNSYNLPVPIPSGTGMSAQRIAIAGMENYTYAEADTDWHKKNPCRDLLKIHP